MDDDDHAHAFSSRIAHAIVLVVLALVSLVVAPAHAAVWLQIDSRGHAAPIVRLDADAARDLVVTASDDKTARVWRLSDGTPLAVLRPAVGPGRVGRVFGAALHPTRDLVAIGGTGSAVHAPGPSIWLFEATTGRFVRRIDARGDHVRRLAWTADGALLVACYAEPGAIRVFDAEGALRFEETLGGDCLAASSRGDRIVAATRDAAAHVFRMAGQSVSRTGRFALEADPLSIHLSPDGTRIAIGYFTPGAGVTLHAADTGQRLARLAAPNDRLQPSANDPISKTQAVAWSSDGRVLTTGGVVDTPGRTQGVVRRFDVASGRMLSELAVSEDTVLDLVPLPPAAGLGTDAVAWASFAGDWGVSAGETSAARASSRVDFLIRRGASELRVAPDARVVRWRRGPNRELVAFELPGRRASTDEPPGLAGATTRRGLFDAAQNFENNFLPMVRNRRVSLETGEVSRALTYVGDDGHVVLATDLGLRRLDTSLNVVWDVRTSTEVRAVAPAADGRLLVTTMSDGTVRWWRAADGTLLLTLLATREGWVLWSPTGHFDASHGAESLIGWLIDRDDSPLPDHFTVARFRERYHRPDVIDRVLDVLDPEEAVRRADAEVGTNPSALASLYRPSVQLRPGGARPPGAPSATPTPPSAPTPSGAASPQAPSPSATTPPGATPPSATSQPGATPGAAPSTTAAPVDLIRPTEPLALPPVLGPLEPLRIAPSDAPRTFRFTMRTQSPADAVRVEVRVDGKLTEAQRVSLPPRLDGATPGEVTVAMNPAVQTVQLVARSGELASEPLRFRVDGDRVRVIEPARPTGTLYVLAIGVGKYADPKFTLQLPAKDATDFVEAMRRQRGALYRDVLARVLTDQQATRDAVVEGLGWLRQQVGPDDVGLIFLAGHGVNDRSGRYHFLPADFDMRRIEQTTVTGHAIAQTLASLRGRAVMFMDTCYAGSVADSLANVSRDTARFANGLTAPESSVSVFASSTGRQESFELDAWGNGAFTKIAVQGLAGGARMTALDMVTMRSLSPYLTDGVAKLTEGKQTPVAVIPDVMPDRILSTLRALAAGGQ